MTFIPHEDETPADGIARRIPSSMVDSQKVHRDPMRVVMLLTDGSTVEGFIHLPPLTRPLDLLNQTTSAFLAVTDAHTTGPEARTDTFPFLAVSKAQIVKLHEAKYHA